MKAGDFLPAARGRLLPVSLPMRFFGAAVVYHLLGWLALWMAADTWLAAPSAPGWPLAALHLFTLGVLVMTALGAAAQLLPVATRQEAPHAAWLAAVWWLFTPGVAVLVWGMAAVRPELLATGTAAAVVALVVWMALVVRNLHGARGMRGVVLHGWAALLALAATLLAALMLVAGWWGGALSEALAAVAARRELWLGLHRVAGPWGFMGLLSLGVAYILVPMFALGDVPAEREQLRSGAAAAAALVLAAAAAAAAKPAALAGAALALGALAVLLHLRCMRATLASGMRKHLGRSFVLARIGWFGLLGSLGLAGAIVAGTQVPRAAAALGLCVIGVWLLSFLLGLLQRIVPFLAAMHGGPGRRNPTPAALTHEGALRLHFACHVGALLLLAAAVGRDEPRLVRAGAATGALGALAFATFFATVLRRRRVASA